MKRISLIIAITAIFLVPSARAQNHAEFGAFADYFKLNETGSNFAGAGARFAVNVNPYIQFEAEMSYDFNQVFTENFTSGTGTVTAQNSNIKVLHGLIGPKLQTKGPVRLFVTVKGGATNFRFDPSSASFSGFTDSVSDLRTNNVSAALYPGGGVEAFLGPIGLRAEVGDEIIFFNGARHNWKVTFGPQIRF
jgi:hypothetical protein